MKIVLPLVLMTALGVPALAHHGWGSYDADKPMTIRGQISKVALQNPHGEMVVPHNGTPWLITLAPLSRMTSRGATGDIFKAGTDIVAFGYPKQDGTPEIRAEWIEAQGRRFQLR